MYCMQVKQLVVRSFHYTLAAYMLLIHSPEAFFFLKGGPEESAEPKAERGCRVGLQPAPQKVQGLTQP